MINLLKNNIKPIIIFLTILFLTIYFILLKTENKSLKEKYESQSQQIKSLNYELEKSQNLIKEIKKQSDIENKLIEEKRYIESELNVCKDDFSNELNNLIKEDNNVKDWCSQEIPYNITSILTK